MLISNKIHYFRNFDVQNYKNPLILINEYTSINEPKTNPSERSDARGLGNTVPSAPTGGCHVVTGG